MGLVSKPHDSWPYARNAPKDSLGEFRVTLSPRLIGSVHCWETQGEARRQFDNGLKGAIIEYLTQNSVRAQESGSYLSIPLFMVGRQPGEAKPTVMFVSDDKKARKEAFDLIKRSNIMAGFPGFELGHSNFQKLMALGGDATCVYSRANGSTECLRLFTNPPSSSGGTVRMATAGGIVKYRGKLMILTADHFLQDPAPTNPEPTNPAAQQDDSADDSDDDSDYEITGLGSFYGNDFVGSTSQGSLSDGAQDEDGEGDLSGSWSSGTSDADAGLVSLGNPEIGPRISPPDVVIAPEAYTEAGRVVLRCENLDFALIEVNGRSPDLATLCDRALPLDSTSYIESPWLNMDVETITPDGGTIAGTLSCTSYHIRLPRSKTFIEAYTARFGRPICEGDSGSWVRNAATGRLLGYIFAGSLVDGLTVMMPARLVFGHARAWLDGLSAGQLVQADNSVPDVVTMATRPQARAGRASVPSWAPVTTPEAFSATIPPDTGALLLESMAAWRNGRKEEDSTNTFINVAPSNCRPKKLETLASKVTGAFSRSHSTAEATYGAKMPRVRLRDYHYGLAQKDSARIGLAPGDFAPGIGGSPAAFLQRETSLARSNVTKATPQDVAPSVPESRRVYIADLDPVSIEALKSSARTKSVPRSTPSNLKRRSREAPKQPLQTENFPTMPKPSISPFATTTIPTTTIPTTGIPTTGSPAPAKYSLDISSKLPKLQCFKCKGRPDFRSYHEFHQHNKEWHEPTVLGYVSREPAKHITSTLQMVVPFNQCLVCLSKRLYHTYHDAADHLRRAHFHYKNAPGQNDAGKHSGMSGYYWLSASQLKPYVEEVVAPPGVAYHHRDLNDMSRRLHESERRLHESEPQKENSSIPNKSLDLGMADLYSVDIAPPTPTDTNGSHPYNIARTAS